MKEATGMNEPITEILETMAKSKLENLLDRVISEHVSSAVEQAFENARDALDNVVSVVESAAEEAVDDAKRCMSWDDSEMDELKEEILKEVFEKLGPDGHLREDPPSPTIAEQVSSGSMSTLEALHLTLGMRPLTDDEVAQHLTLISKQYEHQFALFLWRTR